ncbi:sigma 54-interacting transcriptional regulator [Pseudomonas sp. NY15374]|uniref:sigma 54-interacting transcriptional regulator n=1 Tax=Pseudomonas sp. NY15374 TaxID=3400357 RepID=UPI003A86E2C5
MIQPKNNNSAASDTTPPTIPNLLADPQDHLTLGHTPTLEQLAETVAFSPEDGSIWMCGQRVMLMHSSALGALRRELAETIGLDKTRGLFTRLGWMAGARDAQLVRERWPDGDHAALFSAGPRLHALEGLVKNEVIRFEFDNAHGHFYAEFLWHNSIEDDSHIAAHGIGSESACWMQIGYASGYASSLLGRLIVYREVECRSTGQSQCRIIGKPAEQWPDVQNDLNYFNAEDFLSRSAYKGTNTVIEPSGSDDSDKHMVGVSSAFTAACHMLRRVASTQATVLFIGESGVGKELFAHMLYTIGPRNGKPFVALNCATLPENLVESELFGVERGAFTGADRSRSGRFERAHGGTLFLDEIATLSLSSQGKLLRVLQEREIERVGGSKAIPVDVRVVAATNLDLLEEVKAGRFREDLYYRLNVYPIHLPPLRERRDDIPLLMNYFLRKFCKRHERNVTGFTSRLVNALLAHPFPGNIRELQNLIERGVISAQDDELMDIHHLSQGGLNPISDAIGLNAQGQLAMASSVPAVATQRPQAPRVEVGGEPSVARLRAFLRGDQTTLGTSLEEIESLLVETAMQRSHGNYTLAAQMLGMTRAQLSYRVKGR